MEEGGDEQGGFAAMLHSLEEECYGPRSPFDAKTKVFYFIRHRVIRDWTRKRQIGKREIIKATGLKLRQVERSIKILRDEQMILVHSIKDDERCLDNEYELHPNRFGASYVWKSKKPRRPTPPATKTGGTVKSDVGVPVTFDGETHVNQDVGVPSNLTGGKTLKVSELFQNSLSKNLLKEPIKEPLKEGKIDFFVQENREREPKRIPRATNALEAQEEIRRQIQLMEEKL